MKICFLPADFSGPGFYRCLFPGMELERQFGHETFVPEYDQKKNIYGFKLPLPDADIYVLHQRPERVWLQLIPELQLLGKKVVCDTDDYYGGLPPNHPARQGIDQRGISLLHTIYGMADALTCSTPFLASKYRLLCANVHVLPNFLDWTMWKNPELKDWTRTRIGWMGNSFRRKDDLNALKGVIGPFLQRHPEVDFVAAGDSSVHDQLAIPEGQRLSFPLVEFSDLPKIMRFDIGLVPLAGHDFNEGKSHLKGLEYAACEIPCIATPSEPYRQWVEEGRNGFLARRGHDWLRHLETLVANSAKREQMGRLAWWKAKNNTIQEHVWRWNELYQSLAGDEAAQLSRDAISRQSLQKPSELAAFLRYLSPRRLKTVVEIGTAQGGTLYALCQVAEDDALIASLDLPGGDLDETSAEDKYGQRDIDKMAAYRKPDQRLEFLQMDSHDPATRSSLERVLGGRPIDLLFIDGDHSYEGVKQDFEMYLPLLAEDGIVAFHDILTHHHDGTQVDLLWAELKQQYKVREFVFKGEVRSWGPWGGIGVIENAGKKVSQHQEAEGLRGAA